MSFTPYDRPVRAAFVGLGRIYDLNMRAYVDNPDVEVVALVDPSEERRAQRQARLARGPNVRVRRPSSRRAASKSTPSKRCCRSRCTSTESIELLGYGWHVNLQKPMCNDLAERAADARRRRGQRPACCG